MIARAQLIDLGVGYRAVDHRVAQGRLHPVHRGVFAVGHNVLTRDGVWLAAVLAAGPAAVLSHRSAAALWEIRGDRRRDVDVIAPRRVRRPHIAARHIVLPPDEVTTHHDVPVTTVARTLFDLAGVLTPQQLEAAITEAEARRLTSPPSLADLVARQPHHRGSPRSRRSSATQATVEGKEVDAAWPEQRLVVELDSFGIHTTRRSFEADRARDRALTVAGWRVVRITWRQLRHHAQGVAADLNAALKESSAPNDH